MTSRHITAAEVRHQQKIKEKERERELEIFSMMGFDSAILGFLAFLVIQSNKKNWWAKENLRDFAVEKCDYAAAYYQTFWGVPGPLLPAKI